MIPYFSMGSTKQTMRNKGIRFGYKSFVLTISDGYPYHVILNTGAKGLFGTPDKDLMPRVVLNILTNLIGIKTN